MISIWLLWLLSIAAGFVGAITGIGGGLVLIPVLTFCGVDIKHAIAASLVSVIAVSNTAASGYVRRHLPNLKVNAYLEVFAVIGSLAGAAITIASGRRLLFFLCGGILFIAGIVLWRRRKQPRRVAARPGPISQWLGLEGSYYDDAEKRTIPYHGTHASLGGLLMFGAGLGVGSSALTVLINDAVMGLPPKVSVATTHLIVGVMALAGISIYLKSGLMDARLVVPVILGAPLGALLGSKWLIDVTNQAVRMIVLVTLIVFGVELLMRGYLRWL